jgi:hypothetical protein
VALLYRATPEGGSCQVVDLERSAADRPLAGGIARVPFRAPVDRRSASAGVLSHVRPHLHRANLVDEVLDVVAPVGTERHGPRAVGDALDHCQRGDALGMAVSPRQARVDDEARAVLHQRMAHKAELRLLARPLPISARPDRSWKHAFRSSAPCRGSPPRRCGRRSMKPRGAL